jgi:hypothetical protein
MNIDMNSDHTVRRPAAAAFSTGWASHLRTETRALRNSIARPWRFQSLCAHASPLLRCALPERPADLKPDRPAASQTEVPENTLAAIRHSPVAAGVMSGFFCLSLWLSLALALWMARGWLGLVFSGQVLSAGTYLVKGLAKKTNLAFSLNAGAAQQLQGDRHVP